jgi:predicted N-formylglutamate amidohydrolase
VTLAAVVSCEHASRAVPARARQALRGARALLGTHRGFDAGAAALARDLARALRAPLHLGRATRLAVDLNRSLAHPSAFSRFTRSLPAAEQDALARELWRPFRAAVLDDVAARARRGDVLHLSVHTFTPRFGGRTRPIDVGLLYDPRRPRERAFADRWLAALAARRPDLRLRRNAPYRGDTDGHTTSLRARFPAGRYRGLELEVSQRFPRGAPAAWRALRAALAAALLEAVSAER